MIVGIIVSFGCFMTFLYIRLRIGLRNIKQQIETKNQADSSLRITTNLDSKDVVPIVSTLNLLYERIAHEQYINEKEKETLDLAIHNITHDIRTPLTVALGYTQKLNTTSVEEKQDIEKIERHLKSISNKLEQLMAYQNILEGNIDQHRQEILISQVLKESVINFYDLLLERGFDIELAIEDEVRLHANQEILERILVNLLGNVLKHGVDKVTISLVDRKEFVQVTITNGLNYQIRYPESLGSRFYSENLSEVESSSGLGLYISQQLAESLSGELILTTDKQLFIAKLIIKKSR